MNRPLQAKCPTCKAAVLWSPESRWRPFCSERCRLIDLGEWFNENRSIAEDESDLPGDSNQSSGQPLV